MHYRGLRLNKLIREELGRLISREVEVEGAMITLTEVTLDRQLERAKVKTSIYPVSKTKKALAALESKKGTLRRLLMQAVPMRSFPEIYFEIDHGPEHAARIERLLEKNKGN